MNAKIESAKKSMGLAMTQYANSVVDLLQTYKAERTKALTGSHNAPGNIPELNVYFGQATEILKFSRTLPEYFNQIEDDLRGLVAEAAMQTGQIMTAIAECLKSGSAAIRYAALRNLHQAEKTDKALVRYLVPCLNDRDDAIAILAAQILAKIGWEAREAAHMMEVTRFMSPERRSAFKNAQNRILKIELHEVLVDYDPRYVA